MAESARSGAGAICGPLIDIRLARCSARESRTLRGSITIAPQRRPLSANPPILLIGNRDLYLDSLSQFRCQT